MSKTRNETVVLGAEAASHAALDAGVKGVFGYPGTPSTEVFETAELLVEKAGDGRVATWAANEKAAMEMALGASYAGYRSIVTMKHVGLNVAMDAFVNAGMTGANGGLVVLVADDPGMHSSQNEQDSRYLADFALVPALEPSTPQEVYDYTRKAFDISEALKLPVLVKLVTRLAHSRGFIHRSERLAPLSRSMPDLKETIDWVLVPSRARGLYERLRAKYPEMEKLLSEFNQAREGASKVGIVASGMGRAYFDQLITEEPSLASKYHRLDVGGYPLNEAMLLDILEKCETVYVLEENYPYLEDKLRAMATKMDVEIRGRRDNTVSMAGELTPLKLRQALGMPLPESKAAINMELVQRLPRLCDGCGHIDAFSAMKEAAARVKAEHLRFYGDIGCYTLGAYPPFDSIHTTVEMGASQGMAIGAALVGAEPAVGIMGDSTFFHSGLPNLVSLAQMNVNVTFVIMDNRSVAMTGQQKTVALDNIPEVVKGAGFKEDQIHVLVPLKKNHEENVAIFEKALRHKGPDVVIFRRECIQAMRRKVNR